MLRKNKNENSVDVAAIKTELEAQISTLNTTKSNADQREVLQRVLSLIKAYDKEKNENIKKLYGIIIEDCYRICKGNGSAEEKKEEMADAIDSRFRDAQQPNCGDGNKLFRASMLMLKDPVERVKINKLLVDIVTDTVANHTFRSRMFALKSATQSSSNTNNFNSGSKETARKKHAPRIERRN